VDRLSAFEKLAARAEQASEDTQKAQEEARLDKERRYKAPPTPRNKTKARTTPSRSSRQGIIEAMAKSVVRAVGSSLGRQLARGLLGSFLKGR
jgi:uncharacterized protein